MSVIGSNALAGASGQGGGGYVIEKSLRFNSGDSAYLSRTPSSSGNRQQWTFSAWIKFSSVVGNNGIFEVPYPGGADSTITSCFEVWYSGGGIRITDQSTYYFTSSALLRDPSAWGHLVIRVDTTLATAADRIRLYWNGDRLANTATGVVAQNAELAVNKNAAHQIGNWRGSTYSNLYYAEIHHVDGQSLDPTEFAAYDDNNVWRPIEYTGTYGTNGFHLDFADGIGTDNSGNNNNWTANNLTAPVTSVTPPQCYQADALYTTVADIVANGTLIGTNGVGGASVNNKYCYIVHNDFGVIGSAVFSAGWSAQFAGHRYDPSTNTWTNTGGYNPTSASEWQNWVYEDDGTESSYELDKNWGTGFTFAAARDGNSQPAPYTGTYPTLNTASFNTVETINAVADVFRDSPTNGDTANDTGAGGEVSGNYCTWNPLTLWNGGGTMELVDGNLNFGDQGTASRYGSIAGSIAVNSGKWFVECTLASGTGLDSTVYFGLLPVESLATLNAASYFNASGCIAVKGNAQAYKQGGFTTDNYASGIAVGDTLSIAFNCDDGTSTWYLNGTSLGSFPYSFDSSKSWTPFASDWSNNQPCSEFILNCGQRPFSMTPPTGYKALCTANLTASDVPDGSDYFGALSWTGDGTGSRSFTGLSFQPDLTWVKIRTLAYAHTLFDAVRGAGSNKELSPDVSSAEGAASSVAYGYLSSFDSTGFSSTEGSSDNDYFNKASATYVAWSWDAGSSTVSNTDGSITSQVRANPTAGFSIVSYTGTGANATIGHGLNAAPEFAIFKVRSTTNNWGVYHKSITADKQIKLNSTDAASDSASFFQDTEPTSSVISLGADSTANYSSQTMIAYCFAPVEGYSAFGSYTGNGSTDGPFVYLGFKPALLIIKGHDFASNWFIHDDKRPGYNVNTGPLRIAAEAELTVTTYDLDILSNGFKMRTSGGDSNQNTKNFIYMAWASNPFQANGGLAR